MPSLQQPRYMEIAQAIEARIRNGALEQGRMPTVRDLAEEYGVSIATGARALNVLRARGLVRTVERSGCFVTAAEEQALEHWALCQHLTPSPWRPTVLSLFHNAFEQVAKQQGVLVSSEALVVDEETSESSLQRQIRAAIESGIEGLFLLPARSNEAVMRQDEALLQICQAAELPVVLIERNLRGSERPLERDLVACDDTIGGMRCTRHLLEIGRRRIVFLTGSPCSSHDDRAAGYLHVLHRTASALPSDWKPVILEQPSGLSDKQTLWEFADRLVELRADGVICYENYAAMGLILELLARGVRVPADVAVIGFDDMPISNSFTVGVTTYAPALEEMARQALHLMRERIHLPEQPPVKAVVPGKLIVRESTVDREREKYPA